MLFLSLFDLNVLTLYKYSLWKKCTYLFRAMLRQKCDANQRKAKFSANFPILTGFDPIIMGLSSLNVKPLCYSAGPKHQYIVEDKKEPEAEGPEDRGQEEDCPLHELPDKIDDILRVGC
jgi:hypothetical protein